MVLLEALAGNVPLTVCRLTSCRDDALPFVYIKRRRGHRWSTYHDILTLVVHGAAGDGGWFSPTVCNARCTKRAHNTDKPHQCSFGRGLRSLLQGEEGWCLFSHRPGNSCVSKTLVWSCSTCNLHIEVLLVSHCCLNIT